MDRMLKRVGLVVVVMMLLTTGCKMAKRADYDRPLPPGAPVLQRLEPDEWPSFQVAYESRGTGLAEAIDRSRAWFGTPSSKRFFPSNGITHEQARLSAEALREALVRGDSPDAFLTWLHRHFDVYRSAGWDGRGTVLFTGYYAPVFAASTIRTEQFGHPLYQRPPDLVCDPLTGQVLGRQVGKVHVRYPVRAQIERDPGQLGLAGRELVWLEDRFDAYIIHVNGSARLRLTDGSTMHIGYAGSNGRPYTSIGRLLVKDDRIGGQKLSLPALRRYFSAHPEQLDDYLHQNERFIFFKKYDGADWPAGSLGFKVTRWRSLATDKAIFPRAGVTLVVTDVPHGGEGSITYHRFEQFMVDQDTGGAIRAPGRADIYMGVGSEAEDTAGRQSAEGRLYYLFLKPEQVESWRHHFRQRMAEVAAGSKPDT